MYPDIEKLSPKYEQRIRNLLEQIREYKTQINHYKKLLEDKNYHITQLYNENLELKAQIQRLQQPVTPSTVYAQQLDQPQIPNQITQPTSTPIMPITKPQSTSMKRLCPNCGASGFAIREIEDKTQIISYVPRRIYAKKKHCTKCAYEF